jgi:Uma2 family endonuclease
MSTATKITTAQQLLAAPDLGRCELVQGELVMMSPAGFEHGRIVIRITVPLATHVQSHGLGVVVGAETGFQLQHDPDTVRAPDVASIRSDRAPQAPLRSYFDGPPDLAVEVLSPDDRPRRVATKVREWLQAGCSEVWVVNPATQTVTLHTAKGQETLLQSSDEIVSTLLEGFHLPVAQIFARS